MVRRLGLALAMTCAFAAPGLSDTAPGEVIFDDGAIAESLSGAAGNPDEGVRIMTTNALGNCVACHQIDAIPEAEFQGTIGPALDGAGDRWSPEQLRGIVANAKMTFPDSFMPAFYKTEGFIRPGDGFTGKAPTTDLPPALTAQQVEDVVAFLITLKEE